MDYLALYRKYRPSNLDDVVGQEEIKKILSTSIVNGTITHAYLFSGPRGTGKTTMAKILAKMVNCLNPVNGNPCNECTNCKNLFNSSDIIEIDAASNNGVDEIRDLREKANLVPSMCKYKVYIIDEVHMLTVQAFNALLKTLEEPPKHVIFILATTEYHKIPLTITSRCQKFQFNKIDDNLIVLRLRKIADLEKIEITDEALMEIAKISDGGMRDSINFLDQLRSFKCDEKITVDDVYDVCGNVSVFDIKNLLVYIKNNDVENITLFFEKLSETGKNYTKFMENFCDFLKDVILFKNNVSNKLINSNKDVLNEVADLFSIDIIYSIINDVNVLIDRLRFVSRQSIFVITNFLLVSYNLNKVSESNKLEKKMDSVSYEMAFDIGKSKSTVKEDVNLNTNVNDTNVEENSLLDNVLKNREIIINNAFSVADKTIKNDLHKKYDLVSEYLTDKKFGLVSGMLADTNLEVAGTGYIILTGKYDAIVNNINNNYQLFNELINKVFDGEYKFVVITKDEWNKYKMDYISNIKSGKKYEVIDLDDRIIDINVLDKEPTVVDKLFSIVGEDSIEFK
ncbi:MAG: DNA polymerase III subunit gamma/tau [Erysipelotrichaceae bacterium]|nr:DNA polymerase III subunit gamma/tau [Erysipelotrichaceae bacterium]